MIEGRSKVGVILIGAAVASAVLMMFSRPSTASAPGASSPRQSQPQMQADFVRAQAASGNVSSLDLPTVRVLQRQLVILGRLQPADVDGRLGPRTKAAMEAVLGRRLSSLQEIRDGIIQIDRRMP